MEFSDVTDPIREAPGQVWEFITSIPSNIAGAFSSFNPLTLVFAIIVTVVVSLMFWMPEMMGMTPWPLYIKLVIPPATFFGSYVLIQNANQ